MPVAKLDANYKPTLIGVSSVDGTTIVLAEIDPATGRLLVDAAVTGTGLPTTVIDNEAVNAADFGTLVLGTDGSNYQILATDATGNLQVDILNASLAVTGTFWQATQPVSLASMPSTPVTGTFYQATQPVSLASVPSHAVTNAGTFATQATLQTGTNSIGKLAANSGVDIGDVDVTSFTIATPTNNTSAAYEASSVSKASAGTLWGFSGYNSKTSAQFILFFNSTTVPADATAAVLVLRVPASTSFAMDFGIRGRAFSTGIAWSNSSTSPTKTIGSADVFLDVNYT